MSTSGGKSESSAGQDARLGEIVENYRLVSVLGTGSTSVVYLGRRLDDPEAVAAVKVLTFHEAPGPSDRATFRTRFLREARAASKLRHDHILPVLSYGEVDDLTYMVLPVVTGGTLATRLAERQGPFPLAEIADYASQIASALDFAHAQGIVHRDVKPSNILVDEHGQLYLTDFGIARLFDSGANALTIERVAALTVTGQVLGTPYYMAPEQIKGEPVGPATDVYALGVLLYQMVTGQVPYQGDTPLAVAMQHLQDDPCPPSLLRQELPMAAETAMMRAVAKQPADRFASAGALAQAFAAGITDVQPADWRDTSNDTRPASSSLLGLASLASAPSANTPSASAKGLASNMSVYSSIRSVGPHHELVGTTIGSYKLEQLLAVTDIGPIYRARSASDGTPYRLRLLSMRGDLPAESRSMLLGRFQQVAHNVAELQHPYILPLLDYGSSRGMPYLISPNVAGPSLTERLAQSGPMELVAAGRNLDQMSAALEYAHEHGLLHRNLTSDCVYAQGANELAVADFEARRMAELGGPNAAKSMLYYDSEACSPEQLQGKPADTSTDVYALGVVLYRMLTGHPVYTGSTRDDIAQQHLHAPVPPMRRWRSGLPAGLENVLARALAKDPEQRYRHPAELATAYRALVGAASTGKFNAGTRQADPGEQPALVTPSAQVAQAAAGSPAPAVPPMAATPVLPAEGVNPPPLARTEAAGGLPGLPLATGTPTSPPQANAAFAAPAGGVAPPPARGVGTERPPEGGQGAGWRDQARAIARDPRGRAIAILAAVLLVALLGWVVYRAIPWGGRGETTLPSVNASVIFLDNDTGSTGASDALTISSTTLADPPSGTHYGAWMIDDNSEHVTALGNVVKQSDGKWSLRFNSGGKNLVGAGNRLEITREKDDVPAPGPSDQVVLEGKFAPNSFAHVKHLLVGFPTTPGQQGLQVGLLRQTQVLNDQAQLLKAYVERGWALSAKCQAQSILDVLEGKQGQHYRPLAQECQDRLIVQVGDGFGIIGDKGYVTDVIDHATLAATSDDASKELKEHAGHVNIAAENVRGWLETVDRDTLAVLNGDTSKSNEIAKLSSIALFGQDTNGDESVDPVKNEAGVNQGYHHAQLLADLTLAPPKK